MKRLLPAVSLGVAMATLTAVPSHAAEPVRLMAFGNSFYENSVPWFQPTMFATAGEDLTVTTRIGPGWQVWMHANTFRTKPASTKDVLASGEWDTMLIHHFGSPLLKDNVQTSMFEGKHQFDQPRDVSDFASASFLIEELLTARPDDGRVLIYNSWPYIPGAGEFRKRVQEETVSSMVNSGMEREEVLQEIKQIPETVEQMRPLLENFDYSAEWLGEYKPDREKPWLSEHTHSRDYSNQLFELLKERFPELWSEQRLQQIPNGDVFLEVDRRMRAGEVPGLTNIGFYYTDGGHLRAGLPRYTLAATTFAVLYGRHPKDLDATIYNDLENYRNENVRKLPGVVGSAYVHMQDCGELLEITPERKAVIDDAIWTVVSGHPHTAVSSN